MSKDEKKSKEKKKLKPNMTQKGRVIEYAREVEADESGELFEKAIKKVTKKQNE